MIFHQTSQQFKIVYINFPTITKYESILARRQLSGTIAPSPGRKRPSALKTIQLRPGSVLLSTWQIQKCWETSRWHCRVSSRQGCTICEDTFPTHKQTCQVSSVHMFFTPQVSDCFWVCGRGQRSLRSKYRNLGFTTDDPMDGQFGISAGGSRVAI